MLTAWVMHFSCTYPRCVRVLGHYVLDLTIQGNVSHRLVRHTPRVLSPSHCRSCLLIATGC
jgi:hypothetical protein